MCLIASAESGLSELIIVLLTHNDIVSYVSRPVSGKFQLYFSYLRPAVAIVPVLLGLKTGRQPAEDSNLSLV